MKAMIAKAYGPPEVFEMQDLERPVPEKNEILIRICATTVTAGDCETRRFDMPLFIWWAMRFYMGIQKPKRVLGSELSGIVEDVGSQVTRFHKGDRVFAFSGFKLGAYAEYITLPETGVIALKPENMTHEEAAAVQIGGLNALGFLRKAQIKRGDKILVYGASGSIGTFAIQIAKIMGTEVTAVCSERNFNMVRSIGADFTVDYTREDYAKAGAKYDCVFDAVGKDGVYHGIPAVKRGGTYIQASPRFLHLLYKPWISLVKGRRVLLVAPTESPADLNQLKRLIEAGKLRSVMDRVYDFNEMVEAHRYVEKGHKRGNVAIRVFNGEEDNGGKSNGSGNHETID
jgi:NADPH:quinone reductase-like Zn-dependent oxidoreductase